jgi:hypothetical protein
LTADPDAETEADFVGREGTASLPIKNKFTDVKFGFAYELLLVAATCT